VPPVDQIIKVSDEGTNSPFMARLFSGMLDFRDQLFLSGVPLDKQGELRTQFDHKFESLFNAASATREAALEIMTLVNKHQDAIQSGKTARIHPDHLEILETIDTPISQSVSKLLDQSIVATKTCLQSILHDLFGVNIDFFFQKDANFNAGIKAFIVAGDIELAKYLEEVRRNWYENLHTLRVLHEHEGWVPKNVTYQLSLPSKIVINIPKINDLPVDIFGRVSANRVLLFIENMMVFSMFRACQTRPPYQPYTPPFFLTEIPLWQRDPSNMKRFRLAPKGLDSSIPWIISYVEEMDFL
jgi:hypothetical protein